MNKNFIISGLAIILIILSGVYWYTQKNPSTNTLPITQEIPANKRKAVIAVMTDDQGIQEGLELSMVGINGTKNFSVFITLAKNDAANAVARIHYTNSQIQLLLGPRTITINTDGTPSDLFIEKTKLAYNHDPLPGAVDAFDALRILAIGLSRTPLEEPFTPESLYENIIKIKQYNGEGGTIERDGDHFRRLP